MQAPRFLPLLPLLALGSLPFTGSHPVEATPSTPVNFSKEILPILRDHCLACHGPEKQKSGYRLDHREDALKGGESGTPAITAGAPDKSPFLHFVSGEDPDMLMPPKKSTQKPLSSAQIATLRAWIEQGAPWAPEASAAKRDPLDWWSLKPLIAPALPSGTPASTHPIDAFVLAKLREQGLTPSPRADQATLLRRLSFDLTGLPPSEQELSAFLSNPAPDAYEQAVERLLASPRYGERWARHWLDVVHYGDTHGYDKDQPRPNAWPYRDYLIRALNEDKPYARFVQEQIAGDILFPQSRDGIQALGFLAAGPWDLIGHKEVSEQKVDGKIARHLDRDDMVANTIGTFCSTTIHCAQCHNHKFDPITQEDYYSLQAVFAAVDRADKKYFADPALTARYTALEAQVQELTAKRKTLEKHLESLAGAPLQTLQNKIDALSKATASNPGAEFGYHSAIASTQDASKWAQVDLGRNTPIEKVILHPCFDTFNNIGEGFGFPLRFKVEACDTPDFKEGVVLIADRTQSDVPNPKLTPQEFLTNGVNARYVRITATRLASRKNDFIFALGELRVLDTTGTNVALHQTVTALDSIEAKPRWSVRNLVDASTPEDPKSAITQLRTERSHLLANVGSPQQQAELRSVAETLKKASSELSRFPKPDIVYAATVHHGAGNFAGTGPSGGKPRPIFLLARGQVTQPKAEVGPGSLAALTFQSSRFSIAPDAPEGERRAALARWITHPQNPLTWRSIVNRLWQYHFGRGIAETANDFGKNGGLPSHPELLDWLATHFRDSGGSLKEFHRLIVTSAIYQQASHPNPKAEAIDANNSLLWRQNRRKLEAEALRDSVLFVSGKLDLTMGGPGWQDFLIEHPQHSPHYQYHLADPEDPKTWRRSVYRFLVRSQTQPWMSALDCADPSTRVDKRNESLSAPQALALLNNGFMISQARHFANRVEIETSGKTLEEKVQRAHQLALGRAPDSGTLQQLTSYAATHGLPNLCRLLLNLNEFAFVN
jgi:hypothetical protein